MTLRSYCALALALALAPHAASPQLATSDFTATPVVRLSTPVSGG